MRQHEHETVGGSVNRSVDGGLVATTPAAYPTDTQARPAVGYGQNHQNRQQKKPIEQLLHEHPKLWRGGELAGQGRDGYSTGFPELDDILPGRGWPRSGLMEVVTRQWGMGELQLLMPLMRSMIAQGKWALWVAPPYQLYAPALAQAGIDNRQVLILKSDTSCRDALWSMEKALQTQNCGLVLAWQNWLPGRVLRRLQLAGETGGTLGVLFRHSGSKYSPSSWRIQIKDSSASQDGFPETEVTLLRARGNFRPFTTRLNLYPHQHSG